MKRFQKKRTITKSIRFSVRFLKKNTLVFLLILFILSGAFIGTILFDSLDGFGENGMFSHITNTEIPTDFFSACKAVCNSSFCFLLFLTALFLMGLTSFGCPIILLTVVIYGFWIGVSQAQMFVECGFWPMIVFVHCPMILSGIAVLIAAKQSILMSCLFSRQLLPFSAHCGSLWHDFKRYLTVYLICSGIVVAAATFLVISKIWYSIP